MTAPANGTEPTGSAGEHKPYVPDEKEMKEFTLPAILVGVVLGIVFGASSLYLVAKVGMTVSASIPVAVLAITLFRGLSRLFGFRTATILENNITQTAGSAGESIAFGVGVTMPAMMLIGFDMDLTRVMVVSLLGGLLGILMMIPLRRAFIVQLHGRPGEPGKLLYPEGTACAQVLISGEKGGTSGKTVFIGFFIAFFHHFITEATGLLKLTITFPITVMGKAAKVTGDMASEMLGVGYIIGLRTSAVMFAGAVLGFLVLTPVIAAANPDIDPGTIYKDYVRYIGAGCVAAAGIISMCRTLPMIVRSVRTGLSSLQAGSSGTASGKRTENDMSMRVVIFGSLALLAILAAFLTPDVGIGGALLGAVLVLLFGFLFVTVSSRLTGEIGSSSNPISGMTVATLLMTCLIFLAFKLTTPIDAILALSIGGVVCIAASNGGTTSQDLKTGFLVGGTPRKQQWAIIIGALTSAVVIGFTLLLFNNAGTTFSAEEVFSKRAIYDPVYEFKDKPDSNKLSEMESFEYQDKTYRIWTHTEKVKDAKGEETEKKVRFLVDTDGIPKYRLRHYLTLTKEQLAGFPVEEYRGTEFKAWTVRRYEIGKPALDTLAKSGIPIDVTKKLAGLDGKSFSEPDDFEAAMAKLLDPEELEEHKSKILDHDWSVKDKFNEKVPLGRYLVDEEGKLQYFVKVNVTFTKEQLAGLKDTMEHEKQTYHVWWAREDKVNNIAPGKYLVDDQGVPRYLVDPGITGKLKKNDAGEDVKFKFEAPKTQVMGIVIGGLLKGNLKWDLILIGAAIAVTLELCGISSLAFAVGVYVPMQYSTPIFLGGIIRYCVDAYLKKEATDNIVEDTPEARARAEVDAIVKSETSPGMLLSSGYIAGGSIAGVLYAFINFSPTLVEKLDLTKTIEESLFQGSALSMLLGRTIPALMVFAGLMALMLLSGIGTIFKSPPEEGGK